MGSNGGVQREIKKKKQTNQTKTKKKPHTNKNPNNRLKEQSLQHSGNISEIPEKKQDCIG